MKEDKLKVEEIDPEKKAKKRKRRLKRFMFLCIWIYIFSKLFIVDFETFVFNKYNLSESWILNYRFLIISAIAIILWIKLGFKRFWKNTVFFFLYPFRFLFWDIPLIFVYRIPNILLKNKYWTLLFGYIDSIISFFRGFKYNALILLLFLLSLGALFNSTNYIILYCAFVIFVIFLLYHYLKRIKLATVPFATFKLNIEILNLENSKILKIPEISDSDKNKNEELSEEQLVIKKQNEHIERILSMQVLLNFISDKLETFTNRRVYLVFMTFKIIYTFIFTVAIFTLINYVLFKIDPTNFVINRSNPVTIFDFIIYSFYSVAPDGMYVEPVSNFAWGIKVAASFIGIVMIGILLMSVITSMTSKYEENVNVVVKFSNFQANLLKDNLKKMYSLEFDDAIERLKEADSRIVGVIENIKKL